MAKRKYPRHMLERLPSGFYFQATPAMRRAGIHSEPLGTDFTAAKVRAEYLNAAWDAIRKGQEPTRKASTLPGTYSHLVEVLRKSREWKSKKPRTIEELEYALGIVEPLFGPTKLERVTPLHCEQFYNSLLDQGSEHKAAKVFKWFRYSYSFGVRFGLTKNNPTLAVRIRHPKSRDAVWAPEQVAAAIEAAKAAGRPCMALAIQIAYDTSLRAGDIRALTWGMFDGESLLVTQAKTDKVLRVPLWPETVAMIEAIRGDVIPLASAPIIRAPHGKAYTKDNFEHRFRDMCRAAGIPSNLQFRDIRRTAATERAEGGATAAEIAASTGHSIGHSARILDTYVKANYDMAQRAQAKRKMNKPGEKV